VTVLSDGEVTRRVWLSWTRSVSVLPTQGSCGSRFQTRERGERRAKARSVRAGRSCVREGARTPRAPGSLDAGRDEKGAPFEVGGGR